MSELFPLGAYRDIHYAAAVCSSNTIQDVLDTLRRRHTIPDLRRFRYSILHPSSRRRAVQPGETLGDLGVTALSVLHLRLWILGGAGRGGLCVM